MKSLQKVLAGMTLTALVGLSSQATLAQQGPNPYSDCGIGAAIFPDNNVGAVISNVIWDMGTTALTSATASPETCSGKNVQAAAFIYETYDLLVEETARGEGEHLSVLLNILEVSAANKDQVVSKLRQKMASHVSVSTYAAQEKVDKAQQYYNAVVGAVS